jgi:hypothetical protein
MPLFRCVQDKIGACPTPAEIDEAALEEGGFLQTRSAKCHLPYPRNHNLEYTFLQRVQGHKPEFDLAVLCERTRQAGANFW